MTKRKRTSLNDYATGKAWKIEKQQMIINTGYRLFSEKGIGQVTMPQVAAACGISRATLFRYFNAKIDLVVTIATVKWEEYIDARNAFLAKEEMENMTGRELLDFYLEAFLDLYRNHSDILRFNYEFNSFLQNEKGTPVQKQPYTMMVKELGKDFHALYQKGILDGTINKEIPEETMYSFSFHIMLAVITRYAVGLAYITDGSDPENELVILKKMILNRFTSE